MSRPTSRPLAGVSVIITRPVGQGRTLARQVRALGGTPVLLPGVSLRPAGPGKTVRTALRAALAGDFALFTSPTSVRFAARLAKLCGHARIAAVGAGTVRVLLRHGARDVIVPTTTQDSAGLLAHPTLADVRGRDVAVVGAPGGRGALQRELRARGARVTEVWVYQRVPARLDARHHRAVQRLRRHCVLLSSAEALHCVMTAFAGADWQRLIRGVAIVSSLRIEAAAREAGFTRIALAGSAVGDALLASAVVTMRRS